MIPGISCSAISISLRPYTCAEILRTQKSELPWLFVCDVFSLGDACSHISLKHINSDQSRLCDKSSGKWGLSPHPHRCWIQCTIQSWSCPERRPRHFGSYNEGVKRMTNLQHSSCLYFFFLAPTILAGPGDSVREVFASPVVILVPSIVLAPSRVAAAIWWLQEMASWEAEYKNRNVCVNSKKMV